MKKDKILILSLLLYAILVGVIHYFKIGGSNYTSITSTISYISSLIPIIIGLKSLKGFGLKNYGGKSILFIVLGCFAWLLGDILWVIYENAVVSLADVAYLLGYPFIFIGTLFGLLSIDKDIFKNKKSKIFFIFTIIIAFLYFTLFPVSWDLEIPVLENIATYGYIFADLILLETIVLVIYQTFTGRMSQSWITVSLGLLLWTIGDIFYAVN